MSSKLFLFTEHFPYNNGEVFLQNEIVYLSQNFDEVIVFPLYFETNAAKHTLPSNVKLVHFNVFSPYSRPKIIAKNIFLILKTFLFQLVKSNHKKFYLLNFRKELNNLLHKISNAERLILELNKHSINKKNCYTYWFNQWTFILSIAKIKNSTLSITTRAHGGDLYEYQHYEPNFYFPFRTFQMKYIDKIVCISEDGKKHLVNTRLNYQNEIIVSRLGVEDNGLNPYNSDNAFTIVSCSGIQRYKRIHLIIEILKQLSLKIKWVHIGDGELKSEIQNQITQLPENISISFMGQMPNSEIMNFYKTQSVNLLINVSESEGIPVSIMEAISFGIPIIATNVGGVAEIVNDQTGFLIDKSFNPSQVANIINEYVNTEKDSIIKKRSAAREFWIKNYFAKDNYSSFIKNVLLK